MASKRNIRRKADRAKARDKEKQCGLKHQFLTLQDANNALGKIFEKLEKPMRSYRCKFCKYYHYGHFTDQLNYKRK